jgi:hypothetical protein
MRILALTLALLAASAQTSHAAPVHQSPSSPSSPHKQKSIVFWDMSQNSVNFLLKNVPQANSVRLAQLRQTFIDLQCRNSNLRQPSFAGGKNLLCTLPGTPLSGPAATHLTSQSGTIIFIANYAHQGTGESVIDNWSGALMLPFLYHALSIAPRNHTFLFAAVQGDDGAKAFFDSLSPAKRQSILGVIALDCLGLGPVQYYLSPFDSFGNLNYNRLVQQLQQGRVDQHLDLPAAAIPGHWFKVDVTREFRYHGIQTVLLHSVTWSNRNLPGSANDTYAAINPDAYYKTFSQLAVYAVELDKPWPHRPGEAAPHPSTGRRR